MLQWFGWGTPTFYQLKLKRGLRRIQYLTQITRLVNTKGFRWRPTQIKVTGTKQYISLRRRGRRYWWASAPWAASSSSPRQSGRSRPGPVCPPRLQSLSPGEQRQEMICELSVHLRLRRSDFKKTPPTTLFHLPFFFIWNLSFVTLYLVPKYCQIRSSYLHIL